MLQQQWWLLLRRLHHYHQYHYHHHHYHVNRQQQPQQQHFKLLLSSSSLSFQKITFVATNSNTTNIQFGCCCHYNNDNAIRLNRQRQSSSRSRQYHHHHHHHYSLRQYYYYYYGVGFLHCSNDRSKFTKLQQPQCNYYNNHNQYQYRFLNTTVTTGTTTNGTTIVANGTTDDEITTTITKNQNISNDIDRMTTYTNDKNDDNDGNNDDPYWYDQFHVHLIHHSSDSINTTLTTNYRRIQQQVQFTYRQTTRNESSSSSSLPIDKTKANDNGVALVAATTTITNIKVIVLSPQWLWCNDPTYIHGTSGQQLRTHRLSMYYSRNVYIDSVQLIHDIPPFHHHQQQQPVIPIPPPSPGSLHSIHNISSSINYSQIKHQQQQKSQSIKLLHVVWSMNDTTSKETQIDSYYDISWLIRCCDNQKCTNANKTTKHTLQSQASVDDLARGVVANQLVDDRNDNSVVFPRYNCIDVMIENEDNITNSTSNNKILTDDKIQLSSIGCYTILDSVFHTGAVLVHNVPVTTSCDTNSGSNDGDHDSINDQNSSVAIFGKALSGGRLSHGQLYGDVFHVRDKTVEHGMSGVASETNIAYTTLALCPHQDLAYYESMPGFQLLHCVENDINTIQGGASILIDVIAAATEFQRLAPELFDTLLRCEVTFIKQRDGADMIYRRPHFHYSLSDKCVTSVRWSPPFEGPLLSLPSHMDEDYYIAYTAFERMIDTSLPRLCNTEDHRTVNRLLPHLSFELESDLCTYAHNNTWEYRMQRGDLLIFNNQRMLHGRRAYTFISSSTNPQVTTRTTTNNNSGRASTNAGRHLIGCYTNIDDTLNQYRILRRTHFKKHYDLPYLPIVGNGSSIVP